jgi:hypothetical protein
MRLRKGVGRALGLVAVATTIWFGTVHAAGFICSDIYTVPPIDDATIVGDFLNMDVVQLAKVENADGTHNGLTVTGIGSQTTFTWSYDGPGDLWAVVYKAGVEYIICGYGSAGSEGEPVFEPIPKGVEYTVDLTALGFTGIEPQPGTYNGLSHVSAYGTRSVPEPSTALAGAGALLFGLVLMRRRGSANPV